MNKVFVKRLISLVMVILMVFPVLVSASNDITIKSIYFQDANGNLVFVDYEYAINQTIDGDHTLYNAIKQHVGTAEEKGKPIYLELSNGKILDYRLAMLDNLFRLQDIIDKERYEVNKEIKCTHELKVVEGKAVIVEIKEEPPEEIVELISITSVNGIVVEVGTTEEVAKGLLPKNTTIMDSKNITHTVKLDWTIGNYDGDVEGDYPATGIFTLPEGIKNTAGLELKVEAIVKVFAPVVEPDFPAEIESVFVGESQITRNTYANIKIKKQYVSVVEAVYVNNELANNMKDEPSQWRILVADGTTADDLKGKISVELREEIIETTFTPDALLGKGFGLGNLIVYPSFAEDYQNAIQYSVKYTVGSSAITVVTDKAELGKAPKDLVQCLEGKNVIGVILYDGEGNEIATIENIMNK